MDSSSHKRLHDDVSRSSIDLVLTDPFYGHFLLGINRSFDDRIPTLGVRAESDGSVLLTINPVFWSETLSKDKDGNLFPSEKNKLLKKGCLKHEILHVVLKHILRCFDRNSSGTLKYPNHRQFNIAADLVVNQYIDSDWLIEGAVTLEQFKSLDLMAERDVEYYYNKLGEPAEPDSSDSQSGKDTKEESDSSDSQSRKDNKEKSDGDSDEQSEAKKTLSDLMEAPSGSRGGSHQDWSEIDTSEGTSREILDNYIDRQISDAVQRLESTNSWGSIPGAIREYLKDLSKEKSEVNWRRAIRLFNETSQVSKMKVTMKRPSKRYKKLAQWPDGTPIYEMIEGVFNLDSKGRKKAIWESKYPGLKAFPRPCLMIAVDTSGSLDTEKDIPLFFSEIKKLYQKSVEISIVEADTQIRRIYSYGVRKIDEIAGRGGTNYDEVISYANRNTIHRHEEDFPIIIWEDGQWAQTHSVQIPYPADGLIYFTDGLAPQVTTKPSTPILWVISGEYAVSADSEEYHNLPGNKVHLDRPETSLAGEVLSY